ncbi:MAG: heme exporter protein CcmD [Chitinophagales bacterium]|nr:heme exporter protein CcmD [Hyphomicrobiales bacterium]
MLDLGKHAVFIIASYGVTGAVLLGLVLWVVLGEQSQQRILKDLEARGVTRRGRSGE